MYRRRTVANETKDFLSEVEKIENVTKGEEEGTGAEEFVDPNQATNDSGATEKKELPNDDFELSPPPQNKLDPQILPAEDVPVDFEDIKQRNRFEKILVEERSVVFLGAVGSGKSTCVGNITGDEGLQRIGLESQTLTASDKKFTLYYRRPNNTYYGINFTIYDTYGFIGDPYHDVWELNKLLDEISDTCPKLHAVIFCVTAVRLQKSGDNILRLISRLGGKDIKSRLKFVVTNAPWKLVNENNFLPRTKATLEKLIGSKIDDADMITSDLSDPNQFEESDPQRAATRLAWLNQQKKFLSWIKGIQTTPIRANRISILWKLYGVLYVYWMRILLGFGLIAMALCVALFLQCVKDANDYKQLMAKNDACNKAVEAAKSELSKGHWRKTVDVASWWISEGMKKGMKLFHRP